MNAILITADAAPVVIDIPEDTESGGATLAELQRVLGGLIAALPFPATTDATVYINDESKFLFPPNPKATALMAPVLFTGDAIHGPMLICGFDAEKGRNLEVPADLIGMYAAPAVKPAAEHMDEADGLGRQ